MVPTPLPGEPPLRLRPPVATDDEFLAQLRQRTVAGEFNWFDDAAVEEVRGLVASVHRFVVALEDGTPIGSLSWFGVPYGPNPGSVAWKIGITLIADHRGRGYGALAQRMLADYLFENSAANRVEADTDVGNVAEQRALERAGFVREGVLRGAQYRQGRWHDLVIYARLRGDVPPHGP